MSNLQITIDDGPDSDKSGPTALTNMLAELKTRGVRAAFFNIGLEAKGNPKALTQMIDGGHMLGNHSWDHLPKGFASYSDEEIISQFRTTHEEILKTHKISIQYWRAPRLEGVPTIQPLITTGAHPLYKLTHCDCHGISIDTQPGANAQTMLANIRASLAKYPGIKSPRLLFHVKDNTATHLKAVLDDLAKEGHVFVDFAQPS